MVLLFKLPFTTMQLRCISTGVKLQASQMQFGRIFNKVMLTDHTKKSRKDPMNPHPLPVNFRKHPGKATTHKNRRVTVLNKVFMKYITDLMATGEVGSKLVNRGVEISHVNVAPDFSVVNVYWFALNDSNCDESVERILQVSAGHLQHELSQLRVIGLVPPINFVKNKHYGVLKEVEDLLAKVDFGEDYTPTAHIVSSKIPVLETSLSEELRTKVTQVDSTDLDVDSDEETYSIEIPEMRQDVMGFNHVSIMNKVKNAIDKSRIAEQNRDACEPSEPQGCEKPTSQEVFDFLSSKEQKKLFNDFLKKRAIEEKRKQRMLPLYQVKMEEEMDWVERMKNEDNDDDAIDIDETFRDDCANDSKSN